MRLAHASVLFASAIACFASTGPIPLNCNRACLEGSSIYLAGMVAHDPKRAPLSADVIYIENDQLLDVGDATWKTIEGRGSNRQWSVLVNEAFLIENGKIRRVEMVGPSVPYHLGNPFGGLSGN